MVFNDVTDEKKEIIIKYTEHWGGIKNEIKAINGGKEIAFDKTFMSIKFNLSPKKPLQFHAMTIIVRSFFGEDCKLYPQICLDECFYEL